MKEILITGSHGFLGSCLAQRLELDNKVRRLSREDYYSPEPLSADLIFHTATCYEKILKGEMIDANISGLVNLLTRTENANYQALIVVGSSSEYGVRFSPMKESDQLQPTTYYAATKVAASNFAKIFAQQKDKPVAIVRPFSLYGPDESDSRFIPTVIRSCLTGEPMSLCREATHDWTFVEDFIDGMLLVSEHAQILKGESINIAMGKEVSNDWIVEAIEMITAKTAVIKNELPPNPLESPHWLADNSRIKSLGWKPKHTLVKGLIKTVEFYEKKYRTK